ncbi:YmfQ family protein [Burkholderia cenocepacia]|uniref:YmfQ family protein n=1 Tax=Burkholderia cenocepacia TaxID=95486 RepID=UPI0009B49C35|nr:putative phage tail protein [Burkholderia cenocepacia]
MRAPNFTSADFLRALQGLMPRGRVWPRSQDAVQTKALSGLAPSYERQTARANYLLVDAFPATATELLPEWEESLGLPDPCAGSAPTLQQRRSQVVARFANSGGQSIQFYIDFAKSLGFDVTVTQFAPFRVGQNSAGDAVNSEAWAHTWRVNAPAVTISYFRAGQSAAGEPLAIWGNSVLACEMRSIKPAHTQVIVANPGFLGQSFVLDISTLS